MTDALLAPTDDGGVMHEILFVNQKREVEETSTSRCSFNLNQKRAWYCSIVNPAKKFFKVVNFVDACYLPHRNSFSSKADS
jgi:hypothetical protein